ncbi:MAG: transcriptional regulator [Clostridia bacterium]|jgi:putative transcriptional regulator|nr:transcriptional regulator [Clostridia bacterium]
MLYISFFLLYIFSKASFTLDRGFYDYVKLIPRGDRVKNKIKELRELNDMTQQELADNAEVSRQTIISLESGKYNPSILLAFKIARIFGKSIEEVFIFEEE